MLAAQPQLDTLLAPLGGGGLIAGVAIAARGVKPEIEIFGVQSERFPAFYCALAGIEPDFGAPTIAEGIAVKAPGKLTLPIVRELVREVLLVDEGSIERAIVICRAPGRKCAGRFPVVSKAHGDALHYKVVEPRPDKVSMQDRRRDIGKNTMTDKCVPAAGGRQSTRRPFMNRPETVIPTLTDKLVARKEGAIGWIIFNNPARHNATSYEMWQSLPLVLEEFAADPDVRVIVLRGAGEKAFSAGADISQFKEKRTGEQAVREYNAASDKAHKALSGCPKPTIAMIRGYCIGGGTAVAVGCDIRIAAEDARFGVPAGKLGLGYRYAGIERLAKIVGPSFAGEIFFTARQFTAQEAREMNLVNRVVPAAELESYTREYANTIAANAPLTIAAVKRALIEYVKDPEQRDLALCQRMVDACYESEDYREGQAAFAEKRKPVFKGR